MIGIGTEPEPMKILKFDQLKCFKRQKVEIELPSLSENRRVRFNVTSELVDIFDGAKEVYTEPRVGGIYQFHVMPREIKKYEGHLVFTGHEMLKINNPEYDSDDESFGARRPPELIEVPDGPEIKIIYKIELNAIKSDPASTVTVYTAVGEMVRLVFKLSV